MSSLESPFRTGPETRPVPPIAPKGEHRAIWHGETVVDEYYWFRDRSNPELTKYLEAENAYTEAMTASVSPFSGQLYKEMVSHIKQTDLTVPVRNGGYLYYTRTEEGKQYPIYCRRRGSIENPEEILLNLNELAEDRAFVSLGSFSASDDQNLLAYTVDYTGFRQYKLQVKDLRTGAMLPDSTERVTGLEWAADNKTLFLTTENAITKRSDTLWRHALGSSDFELLYEEIDELYDVALTKTRDKRYLLLGISSKDTTEFRYLRADHPSDPFAIFLARGKKHRYYVDHREGLFYIRTNRNGKNFEIVTTADGDPEPQNWKSFVEHSADVLIEDVDLFRNFAVIEEKTQAITRLRVYQFQTRAWTEISFPEPAYSVVPGDTPDYESPVYRYIYQSFVTPRGVYDYDVASGVSKLLKTQEVPGYDSSQYRSERFWARARDGTQIPISIVYRKDFRQDGQRPLFLYGYGSYGYAIPITFGSERLSLLDRGMAYAVAHIRGGNEMGEQWREDGMLMKKKNTFNDFIDCAEYLVRTKWTSKDRLVIEGRSAGGLLLGAVINMRPDLFKAAHLAVPFVDVMNTMMDATLPLTVGEYLEWGDPSERTAYEYMKAYSPYENLMNRAYPAMLVTTSLNDSQVMYWEPVKYVARLRTLKTDENPLLLKIRMDPAGHGGASGRYDRLKERAFEYAWLLSQVGITN